MNENAGLRGVRSRLAEGMKRCSGFLRNDVWRDPEDAGRFRLFCYQALRVGMLTLSGLRDQVILLRASALSYSTLLAIVPLLAIAFSMLKGLGVHSRIEHLLVNYLTAEQEELSRKIIEYISNTDFKALGAFGTGLLIIAVLTMLSNVERTFNDLWGVTSARRLVRKISDYISVLLLGPLLIVISTAMIGSLSSHSVVKMLSRYELFEHFFLIFKTVLPHAGLWIAFTAIYMLMPNTRVRFMPAFIAGIVCGGLWELAFRLYTGLNIGVARYNTIYGTFAVLPVFIIWLYISWIIVLIGAKMSYAIQNLRSHQQELGSYEVSQEESEEMAVHMMLKIVERFHRGEPPMKAEELSKLLSIPLRLVREIIQRLLHSGLVREIYGEEPCYQPSKNPSLISVLDVCRAIRKSSGKDGGRVSPQSAAPGLENFIESWKAAEEKQLGSTSMMDLLNAAYQGSPA